MTAIAKKLFPTIILIALILSGSAPVFGEPYSGTVKLYMVEPESRWHDANGGAFQFAFLNWALYESITLNDGEVWNQSTVWDATAAGYGDVTADNIMVIGASFNDEAVQQDAYPPYGYYFDAHYVDAAAAGTPAGLVPYPSGAGYTHEVFVEIGLSGG